jgi:hypothetical protein
MWDPKPLSAACTCPGALNHVSLHAGSKLALAGSLDSLGSLDSRDEGEESEEGEEGEEGLSFLLMRRTYSITDGSSSSSSSSSKARKGGIWLGGPGTAAARAGGSSGTGQASEGLPAPFPSDFTISFAFSSYHDVVEDNHVREAHSLPER